MPIQFILCLLWQSMRKYITHLCIIVYHGACTFKFVLKINNRLYMLEYVTLDVQCKDDVMARFIQLENFFLAKGKANLFLSSLFSRYVVLKWQQQVFGVMGLSWYWCTLNFVNSSLFKWLNKANYITCFIEIWKC